MNSSQEKETARLYTNLHEFPRIVTIGHILNEIIKYPDRKVGPVLGSPAAYSAVASSMLGVKTGIVTKIGEDMPNKLLKPLIKAKVDMRGVKVEGSESTTNMLIYDKEGNKTLRYMKKAPEISTKDFPEEYFKAKAMHICPLDNEIGLDTIMDLRKLDILLSTDLGGFGGVHSGGRLSIIKGNRRDSLKELVKNFDIVRASKEDCQYLLGTKMDGEEIIAHLFVEWGAEVGIITCGKDGSIVATEKETLKIPSFHVVAQDPTGAGDTYSAGFIVEYEKTRNPFKSAVFASATASFIVERCGKGIDIKRFATMQEVLERITQCYPQCS